MPTNDHELHHTMISPRRACSMLAVSESVLLGLVNRGQLAAYRIGDDVRFRYRDVESLTSRRAIAA